MPVKFKVVVTLIDCQSGQSHRDADAARTRRRSDRIGRDFAALHESQSGPSLHGTMAHELGRKRGIADMPGLLPQCGR